ncbi:hypothetical protein GCM10009613_46660 [Pseudonocardia kongjuensis]|uniref:Uncharacterized protein n=1 Tax=Pseudonocardia kongjuensis TaxID=102227 RepID=A0ABN1Y2F3_9PSEU
MRLERQALVEQPLCFGDRLVRCQHQVLGHPLDAGGAAAERPAGGVPGAGVAGTATLVAVAGRSHGPDPAIRTGTGHTGAAR